MTTLHAVLLHFNLCFMISKKKSIKQINQLIIFFQQETQTNQKSK